jgi:hypothetical protein
MFAGVPKAGRLHQRPIAAAALTWKSSRSTSASVITLHPGPQWVYRQPCALFRWSYAVLTVVTSPVLRVLKLTVIAQCRDYLPRPSRIRAR